MIVCVVIPLLQVSKPILSLHQYPGWKKPAKEEFLAAVAEDGRILLLELL